VSSRPFRIAVLAESNVMSSTLTPDSLDHSSQQAVVVRTGISPMVIDSRSEVLRPPEREAYVDFGISEPVQHLIVTKFSLAVNYKIEVGSLFYPLGKSSRSCIRRINDNLMLSNVWSII